MATEPRESETVAPQSRLPRLAWIPLAAGALWLFQGAQSGWLGFLLLLPVAGTLLATGCAQLLWAGDLRITQTMALAGALGVLAALPLLFWLGFSSALWMVTLAAASTVAAGALAVDREPVPAGVPPRAVTPRLAAMVAVDEGVLGLEQFSVRLPMREAAEELVGEILDGLALFAERGWLSDPAAYHEVPPALPSPQIETRRGAGTQYEHLSFDSLYTPHPGEPGRDRWLGFSANRTAHAFVLRHGDADRPWLVCCNGYRSGSPQLDLRLFRRYHRELGLNVLIPVLPLHGPRKQGRISGEGFLSGWVMDSLHAEAQAIWDIRRLIAWIRSRGAPAVGALGLSLGGYTTALLAGLQPGLACAVAGIPVADLARLFWRHGPRTGLAQLAQMEVDQALVASLLRPVSPLSLEPLVPHAHRMIFGGTADRLAPPDHVRDLAEHWDHPRTVWYAGGHLTFGLDHRVRAGIDATLRDAKLIV